MEKSSLDVLPRKNANVIIWTTADDNSLNVDRISVKQCIKRRTETVYTTESVSYWLLQARKMSDQ